MTDQAQNPSPPEAPGAETGKSKRRRKPYNRRFTFFKDGNDYVLLGVQRDKNGDPVPNGALNAIPNVPRFSTAPEALRWIRTGGGEKLAGMKVLLVKFIEENHIVVESKPLITINTGKRYEKPIGEDAKAMEAEDAKARE